VPWEARDAKRHTKKVSSDKSKRQWSHVANSMLASGHDEGSAIAAANSVAKKRAAKSRGKRGSK
jgi:uncharacterized protein YdaT